MPVRVKCIAGTSLLCPEPGQHYCFVGPCDMHQQLHWILYAAGHPSNAA